MFDSVSSIDVYPTLFSPTTVSDLQDSFISWRNSVTFLHLTLLTKAKFFSPHLYFRDLNQNYFQWTFTDSKDSTVKKNYFFYFFKGAKQQQENITRVFAFLNLLERNIGRVSISSLTFLRSIQSWSCECLKRRYCFWICEKSEVPWRVWRFEEKPRAAGLDLPPGPQESTSCFWGAFTVRHVCWF